MALQLTIIKFPPGVALAEDRKSFGPQGGLIGRGVDNDWVLSDPERFLSSKHCQITHEGGRFFLIDLSTNGTFVNGAGEPLGRGSRIALNDGDSFDVGDYRFKVALEQDQDPFAVSPFESSSADFFGDDAFGFGDKPKVVPESMFMSSNYEGSVRDIAPPEMKIIDPLVALDNANRSPTGKNLIGDPFGSTGSREDPADRMQDAIAWPEAKVQGGVLPEDWDDDFGFGNGAPGGAVGKGGVLLPEDDSLFPNKSPFEEKASSPPDPRPRPGGAGRPGLDSAAGRTPLKERLERDFPLPADDKPDPKFQPLGQQTAGLKGSGERGPTERAAAERTPPEANLDVRGPGKTGRAAEVRGDKVAGGNTPIRGPAGRGPAELSPTGAHTATTAPPQRDSAISVGTGGALDRTLVEAMGLGEANLSDEQVREIHATVGAMMRESLEGLMQVLRSRTSIKNEFRINITTIQSAENNPLKFSASVDEALDLMFLRRSRAYIPPLEAIEESFHSVADHQVAVIAGIRSAFRSVLRQFDPERLEEEFKQSGKGGVLPGVLKGRMWQAYQEHYQKMINDMERSFQELFGDEFVQAYEDQMRKLSQARQREL